MKKLYVLLVIVLSGCTVFSPLRRGNLLTLHHLIDAGNYEEAKELVEGMIQDDESSRWARTWYARGLLYHTAYREGKEKNDKSLYELYPNQLYVAFSSWEIARTHDSSNRLSRQLAPHYVLLANDFKDKGVQHFEKEEYSKALRAFETALKINRSPVLTVPRDLPLKYNAALAAFQSENWEKAKEHLKLLDKKKYDPNVTHLLFVIYLKEDIAQAEKVLLDGIRKYEDNKDLVMLMVDLLFEKEEIDRALEVLRAASEENPDEYSYHFTRGVIYQKTEQYPQAIEAYYMAAELNPDHIPTEVHIATCYYNQGVAIEENATRLSSNIEVQQQKVRSESAFASAVQWLDKARQKRPQDPAVLLKMYQLYNLMGETEKARSIQRLFN